MASALFYVCIVIFLISLVLNCIRYGQARTPYGETHRAVFERWAQGQGLDTACEMHGGYVDPATATAWRAFQIGLNTPRWIRI